MLGFSVAALAVAAYGASGSFERDADTAAPADSPAPGSVNRPPATGSMPAQLVVTFFLVDSEPARARLHVLEDSLVNREFLRQAALEVLVAGTPEEEVSALRTIEEARQRSPTVRFLVEDLREQGNQHQMP
jgi:hypothetical protein